MYRLELTSMAEQDISRLRGHHLYRVQNAIMNLSENPDQFYEQFHPTTLHQDGPNVTTYLTHVDDHELLYNVNKQRGTVTVLGVKP